MSAFAVSFLKRSAIELADNEKVSLWEPMNKGSIEVRAGMVALKGYWRVSWIGNFLGSGLLGVLLIRPLFMNNRSEEILIPHIQRVVAHKKKDRVTFHFFQSRDEGMVEVHVFTADKAISPQIVEALRSQMPAAAFEERVA
jgi:hypothetical protein